MYDDAFLERLKRREPTAQQAFYEAELRPVERACRRLLDSPSLAEQTAGDVLNDFLYVHVDKVRLGRALRGNLRGWVQTHCRRARRIQRQLGGEAVETATEAPRFEFPQRLARLHGAIETLSPTQRRALRLRYFNGLKNVEVAAELGVSRARVTQLLSRALVRLRGEMEEA